jgi:SAM-dependent methyltransferase
MFRYLKKLARRVVQKIARVAFDSLDYDEVAVHVSAALDYDRIASAIDHGRIAQHVLDGFNYEAIASNLSGTFDYDRIPTQVLAAVTYEHIVSQALASVNYDQIVRQLTAALPYDQIASQLVASVNYEQIISALDYEKIASHAMASLDPQRVISAVDYDKAAASISCKLDYGRIAGQVLEGLEYDKIISHTVEQFDSAIAGKIKRLQVLRDGSAVGPIVPWSPLYDALWATAISRNLADESLVNRFRRQKPLPAGYGFGIDERCVEYPWLLAHLPPEARVILDAGSALNYDFVIGQPAFRGKTVHILTLAPESYCFWKRGVSYLFGDLRDIPTRDAFYDVVVCISSLEHVGCDNVLYTHRDADRENRPDDFLRAIGELRRVLKPGGTLLLTAPYGVYRHFGFQQQFDAALLARAVDAFGMKREFEQAFYRYTAQGWTAAEQEDCTDCEHVAWVAQAWQKHEWPETIPVEPDLAAAARAVACVRLVKG